MNGQQGLRRGVSRQRGERIAKSQPVYEDTTVSPLRVAGAGMGGAAFAYGVPRLQMLGQAITSGTKSANPGTAQASRLAQDALAGTKLATEPVGRAVRNLLTKSPEGVVLMRWSPKSFRPAIATGLGSYLLARNLPPTKHRVRPISGVFQSSS